MCTWSKFAHADVCADILCKSQLASKFNRSYFPCEFFSTHAAVFTWCDWQKRMHTHPHNWSRDWKLALCTCSVSAAKHFQHVATVRFQVLMAASMKFRVFWDVAPSSQVDADRHFRGVYCLHHQGEESKSTWLDGATSPKTLNLYRTGI
jgi:hypothetical protein